MAKKPARVPKKGDWLLTLVFSLISIVYVYPLALVLITVLAVLASALRQTYLHQGFPATLLCTALAMAVYELGIFAFCLLPVGKKMLPLLKIRHTLLNGSASK